MQNESSAADVCACIFYHVDAHWVIKLFFEGNLMNSEIIDNV
jgi:hypothetical protein